MRPAANESLGVRCYGSYSWGFAWGIEPGERVDVDEIQFALQPTQRMAHLEARFCVTKEIPMVDSSGPMTDRLYSTRKATRRSKVWVALRSIADGSIQNKIAALKMGVTE